MSLLIETKSLATDSDTMKADIEGRTLYGYFATWDIDRVRDVIVQGAFVKTFKERGPRKRADGQVRSKIKLGLNHKDVIGLPVRFWEDSKGAGYEAVIDPTPVGDLVIARVKSGSLDQNSFKYDVLDHEYDKESKIRYLKELRVYECGPVDEACNEAAEIGGLKSLNEEEKDTWYLFWSLQNELKAGRPLSSDSLALLDAAIEKLNALRAKAGPPAEVQTPPEPEPTKDATPPDEPPPQDSPNTQIQKALLSELRAFRMELKGARKP